MRKYALGSMLLLVCWSVGASPSEAGDLADLITGLFDGDIRLADGTPPAHERHWIDANNPQAAAGDRLTSASLLQTGNAINEAFAAQLTTFPLGSPGGGFSVAYNEGTGVFERTSDSFGSLFVERAATIGKGKLNFGATYLSTEYDSIDDVDLGSGELAFQLEHQDCCTPSNHPSDKEPAFEADLIGAHLALEIESEIAVFFANFGVTRRFDVGIAVPYVAHDIDAGLLLTIDRLGTPGNPAVHLFGSDRIEPGATYLSDSAMVISDEGDASGLGDVLLRGKYRFADAPGGGLAVAIDARLPTGDDKDLLGTGAVATKVFLVGSRDYGRLSPHFNLGYTFSSGGGAAIEDLPDEIGLAGGLSVTASKRVTFSVDVIGRQLQDARRIAVYDQPFEFRTANGGPLSTALRPILETYEDDIDLWVAHAGLRINPVRTLLISISGLYSLSDDGLRDEDVIPVISIDYSL